MKKRESQQNMWKSLLMMGIFFVAIFLFPIIILRDKYTFFTSIIYSIMQILVLFVIVLGFQVFNELKYFKEKKFKNKIKFNLFNMFIVLMTYLIVVQIFSQFLYFSLRGFASLLEISFYPEKTIFIIPAFASLFIFIIRMLSLSLPLNKKSLNKNVVEEFRGYDLFGKLDKHLSVTRNILRDMVIGAIIMGMIALWVYGAGTLNIDYGYYFLRSVWKYSILFAVLDIVIGISITKTKIPSFFFDQTKEEETPKKKIQENSFNSFVKKHKFIGIILKILGILIFLGIFVFLIFNYFELRNASLVHDEISDWSYEINLTKINYNETTSLFSDKIFKIHRDESKIVEIPLIFMRNNTYPLSSRINDLEQELGVVYLNESLVESINGRESTFILEYKNTTRNEKYKTDLEEGSNYYFSTEYDASIFLTLYENGYERVYSVCKDQSVLTAIQLVKVVCAEKDNNTVFIQITKGSIDFPIDNFVVVTKDNETFNVLKNRVLETEKGLTPSQINDEYNCSRMYRLEIR